MQAVKQVVAIALAGVALALSASYCMAQHVTGELGAPSATTTISGQQLPPPDPQFGGVIKGKATESKAGGRRASCRPGARPTCCSS
jgi:hypothetical protein